MADDRDDDRPRRDRNRDDDDRDAERPRRDRDRDDDDRDYDRPRRTAAKAGIGVGVILAIVLGVLVVCGGVATLLLLPAVSKVREAAARMKDASNMKQVALAMHNDCDAHNGFYAPIAHDKDGNVVTADLSFRVSLLPYVEQAYLHQQFDLTQGWDSPRNRPHSNTPVMTYRSPHSADQATSNTPYRAFVGGGAMFDENGAPVRVSALLDGMANTIMLMAVEDEVPWAAPRELKYSATGPLPRIGSKESPAGANVLMADGSVIFLKNTTTEQVFRALITRNGGETLPADW